MLIFRVTHSTNLKKQYMYMEDIFLETPLLIYFNFFQTVTKPRVLLTVSVSAAYMPVLTVVKLCKFLSIVNMSLGPAAATAVMVMVVMITITKFKCRVYLGM